MTTQELADCLCREAEARGWQVEGRETATTGSVYISLSVDQETLQTLWGAGYHHWRVRLSDHPGSPEKATILTRPYPRCPAPVGEQGAARWLDMPTPSLEEERWVDAGGGSRSDNVRWTVLRMMRQHPELRAKDLYGIVGRGCGMTWRQVKRRCTQVAPGHGREGSSRGGPRLYDDPSTWPAGYGDTEAPVRATR